MKICHRLKCDVEQENVMSQKELETLPITALYAILRGALPEKDTGSKGRRLCDLPLI